jgi:hypothetical protein
LPAEAALADLSAGEKVDPRPAPYHELLRVLTTVDPQDDAPPGCPVCKLVRKALLAYLDDLIYSCGVDPAVRKKLRLARGLCNRHAHLFKEVIGLALGVTLIHWDVVDTVNEAVARCLTDGGEGEARTLPGPDLLARLRARAMQPRLRLLASLRPQQPCMACEHQLSAERIYLGALLTHLDETLLAALRASPGLCLPHFEQALEWAEDRRVARQVCEVENACLTRLSAELQELARKFDHRMQSEKIGPEADSWRRAIDQVTGLRGLR